MWGSSHTRSKEVGDGALIADNDAFSIIGQSLLEIRLSSQGTFEQ
jgi:hypothetical protein